MIAVSSDPLLLNWEKLTGKAVIPDVEPDAAGNPYRVGDPCIWREEDGYYSLSGGYVDGPIFEDGRMAEFLFHSQDLERWIYLGRFVENDIFTAPGEDGAVPYFWPIGDRHILLFASHQRGSQYLIGDYDRLRRRFRASGHGRFNFGPLRNGGVHAPSAFPDGDGGILLIHNINQGRDTEGWNHIMSLVRRLTLNADGSLRVEPAAAIEGQRGGHRRLGPTALVPNREFVLPGIEGNALELSLRLAPESARELRIEVLRSPGREEHTSIRYPPGRGSGAEPGGLPLEGGRPGDRQRQQLLLFRGAGAAARDRPVPAGRRGASRAAHLHRQKRRRAVRQREAGHGPARLPGPRGQRRSVDHRGRRPGLHAVGRFLADEEHLFLRAETGCTCCAAPPGFAPKPAGRTGIPGRARRENLAAFSATLSTGSGRRTGTCRA